MYTSYLTRSPTNALNSPASPERRGGGKGAGWYTRHSAAKGDKGDAQPNSPASLAEGGGGKGVGGGLGTQPQKKMKDKG